VQVDHPLHIVVGEALLAAQRPDLQVILDHDCGGRQRIPLFLTKYPRRQDCLSLLIQKVVSLAGNRRHSGDGIPAGS
jgi:hypothetical protein